MTQSLTKQVNRRSTVQSMASVAVSQPVGRSFVRQPNSDGCCLNQVSYRNRIEPTAVGLLATPKNWFQVACITTATEQFGVQLSRQKHYAGFVSLAVNQKLATLTVTHQILPVQTTQLGDTQTRIVKNLKYQPIPLAGFGRNQHFNFDFS